MGMKKELLEQLIVQGLSTYKIAGQVHLSQTTIRYWLHRYGLRTRCRQSCVRKPCAYCGNLLITRAKRANKFCNSVCMHNYRYTCYVKAWLKGKLTGNSKHEEAITSWVRTYCLIRAGHKCEQCGWAKENPSSHRIPLTVHHKDGDSRNTRPENLEVLCPCCHSLTPTYGSLNNGKGRKRRLRELHRGHT